MNGRLWYPQLDVFDTVRRIGLLLYTFEGAPGVERLYIADFYLANPPLLHSTTMTQKTRKAFNALKIPRPEKTFLSYPAAPLLFHKMEPIQKEALRALAGKGLVSIGQLKKGTAELTDVGRKALQKVTSARFTALEAELVKFIAADFAVSAEAGSTDLRRRTGLRRMR